MQQILEANHAANSNDCKRTWLSWRVSAPGRGDDSSHTARLRTSFPLAPDWIRQEENEREKKKLLLTPEVTYTTHQLSLNIPNTYLST